jgi:ABC-type transport system substrate-binding protein
VTRQLGYNGLILSAGAFAHLSEASLAFSAGGFNYTANSSGFTDPKLAQLVTSAAVEPDLSRRKAIYSQLNDFLLDQCFMMPISLFPSVLAARSGVHGMKYENSNDFTYNDTWID